MFRQTLPLFLLLAVPTEGLDAQVVSSSDGSWENAARKLQQATVTVRIWGGAPRDTAAELKAPQETSKPQQAAVTVCSGFCIRAGRIVTAAFAGSDTPIRLTLPSGKQADAKLLLIDEYSGLALLQADTTGLTPLAAAENLPAVGSELLTAAAWGLEQPLVARGIVGGVNRKQLGSNYPPLLQCDVLTTPTSTGAGLVDRQGRLLGVVVAADRDSGRRGWTYAVPVSHVDRIERAANQQQGAGLVILKRRRPVVGMVLDQEESAIVVQRVTASGPAEKAGIKAGDRVVATDGIAVRSVYQAVLPTLYKQPGDTTTFRIQRADGLRDVEVVLGGGVEVGSAPIDLLADWVQPKVRLSRDSDGTIATTRRGFGLGEVAMPPLPDEAPPPAAPSATDKIALLEKALTRYQAVIELQQRQIDVEQKERQEQAQLIESLRKEIESLRKTAK
jgi:S1-C subfamily serine protease